MSLGTKLVFGMPLFQVLFTPVIDDLLPFFLENLFSV